MCDTIVAAGSATKDGVTLFGKNSDREPNEAQNLCHVPGQDHPPGARVACTHIAIPQVERTHAVLLSQPYWMWGAEMGANEHGLAIGNEAVFTRLPHEKTPGLTGMDLLRLALERATTARQAVGVITALIETYGQGGNCGYTKQLHYHNSFLMADPTSAWLLETAGRHWAAKQIDGVYAISNKITLENEWDLASADLVSFAVRKRWCRSADDFSFSKCYSDFLYTTFSASDHRRSRALMHLNARRGTLGITDFFSILRDHGDDPPGSFNPQRGVIHSQICNHAGWGPVRISQTTGSMVSRLSLKDCIHFATGSAAPCTSLFKPLWIDTPVEPEAPPAGKYFDADSLFWRHEMLHRLMLRNYQRSTQSIIPYREELEADFMKRALAASTSGPVKRQSIADMAFETACRFDIDCCAAVKSLPVAKTPGFLYSQSWRKWNRSSGFPAAD